MASTQPAAGAAAGEGRYAAGGPIEIKVRSLNGPDVQLQVLPDMSVQQLKDILGAHTGVAPALQRLIYRGRVLEDANALQSYRLENGHTLHMVRRPSPAAAAAAAAPAAAATAGPRAAPRRPSPRFGVGTRVSMHVPLNGGGGRGGAGGGRGGAGGGQPQGGVAGPRLSDVPRDWASMDSQELLNLLFSHGRGAPLGSVLLNLLFSQGRGGTMEEGGAAGPSRTPLTGGAQRGRSGRATVARRGTVLRQTGLQPSATLEHIRQGLLTLHTIMTGMGMAVPPPALYATGGAPAAAAAGGGSGGGGGGNGRADAASDQDDDDDDSVPSLLSGSDAGNGDGDGEPGLSWSVVSAAANGAPVARRSGSGGGGAANDEGIRPLIDDGDDDYVAAATAASPLRFHRVSMNGSAGRGSGQAAAAAAAAHPQQHAAAHDTDDDASDDGSDGIPQLVETSGDEDDSDYIETDDFDDGGYNDDSDAEEADDGDDGSIPDLAPRHVPAAQQPARGSSSSDSLELREDGATGQLQFRFTFADPAFSSGAEGGGSSGSGGAAGGSAAWPPPPPDASLVHQWRTLADVGRHADDHAAVRLAPLPLLSGTAAVLQQRHTPPPPTAADRRAIDRAEAAVNDAAVYAAVARDAERQRRAAAGSSGGGGAPVSMLESPLLNSDSDERESGDDAASRYGARRILVGRRTMLAPNASTDALMATDGGGTALPPAPGSGDGAAAAAQAMPLAPPSLPTAQARDDHDDGSDAIWLPPDSVAAGEEGGDGGGSGARGTRRRRSRSRGGSGGADDDDEMPVLLSDTDYSSDERGVVDMAPRPVRTARGAAAADPRPAAARRRLALQQRMVGGSGGSGDPYEDDFEPADGEPDGDAAAAPLPATPATGEGEVAWRPLDVSSAAVAVAAEAPAADAAGVGGSGGTGGDWVYTGEYNPYPWVRTDAPMTEEAQAAARNELDLEVSRIQSAEMTRGDTPALVAAAAAAMPGPDGAALAVVARTAAFAGEQAAARARADGLDASAARSDASEAHAQVFEAAADAADAEADAAEADEAEASVADEAAARASAAPLSQYAQALVARALAPAEAAEADEAAARASAAPLSQYAQALVARALAPAGAAAPANAQAPPSSAASLLPTPLAGAVDAAMPSPEEAASARVAQTAAVAGEEAVARARVEGLNGLAVRVTASQAQALVIAAAADAAMAEADEAAARVFAAPPAPPSRRAQDLLARARALAPAGAAAPAGAPLPPPSAAPADAPLPPPSAVPLLTPPPAGAAAAAQAPLPAGAPARTFYAGQWVDCKDSVGNWLEATVLQTRSAPHEVLIHYHGWPDRWNEWIHGDSPRLAPFCTRTTSPALGAFLSPYPRAGAANAPMTGYDDVRVLLPEVVTAMSAVEPLLQRLSGLTAAVSELAPPAPPRAAALGAAAAADDRPIAGGLPWNPHAHFRAATPAQRASIEALARDAAPLLDRFGRLLADLAVPLAALGGDSGGGGGGGGSTGGGSGGIAVGPLAAATAEAAEQATAAQQAAAAPGAEAWQQQQQQRWPGSPGVRRLVTPSARGNGRGGTTGQIEIHVHAVTVSANPAGAAAPAPAGAASRAAAAAAAAGAPAPIPASAANIAGAWRAAAAAGGAAGAARAASAASSEPALAPVPVPLVRAPFSTRQNQSWPLGAVRSWPVRPSGGAAAAAQGSGAPMPPAWTPAAAAAPSQLSGFGAPSTGAHGGAPMHPEARPQAGSAFASWSAAMPPRFTPPERAGGRMDMAPAAAAAAAHADEFTPLLPNGLRSTADAGGGRPVTRESAEQRHARWTETRRILAGFEAPAVGSGDARAARFRADLEQSRARWRDSARPAAEVAPGAAAVPLPPPQQQQQHEQHVWGPMSAEAIMGLAAMAATVAGPLRTEVPDDGVSSTSGDDGGSSVGQRASDSESQHAVPHAAAAAAAAPAAAAMGPSPAAAQPEAQPAAAAAQQPGLLFGFEDSAGPDHGSRSAAHELPTDAHAFEIAASAPLFGTPPVGAHAPWRSHASGGGSAEPWLSPLTPPSIFGLPMSASHGGTQPRPAQSSSMPFFSGQHAGIGGGALAGGRGASFFGTPMAGAAAAAAQPVGGAASAAVAMGQLAEATPSQAPLFGPPPLFSDANAATVFGMTVGGGSLLFPQPDLSDSAASAPTTPAGTEPPRRALNPAARPFVPGYGVVDSSGGGSIHIAAGAGTTPQVSASGRGAMPAVSASVPAAPAAAAAATAAAAAPSTSGQLLTTAASESPTAPAAADVGDNAAVGSSAVPEPAGTCALSSAALLLEDTDAAPVLAAASVAAARGEPAEAVPRRGGLLGSLWRAVAGRR
ncbi:hypothetical protein JKP88DRAFT_302390 [Tribonema minus]|uniref:Ubiquitin-like domain-containing protein n=1 Tax=Tribonema minus TaxID=303371 RepID=A0A836CL17_9STRA|nr:hypothetical protein JKP88DRAFT_302390 [Tribonema minus]